MSGPTIRRFLLVGVALSGIQGCTGFHAERQDEVGSAHVAVLSVARWEDCVEALQPTFKLTPEEALAQSVPTTRLAEEKFLDALAVRGRVALPGTTFTDTTTTIQAPGQDAEVDRRRTETTTSGDTSRASSGSSPAGSRTAAGLPPTTSVLGTPLGMDPLLKYWAATALYEEVQLINRSLKDAAIGDDYFGYVVRLQVSLLPRVRDLPYDADALVSVFLGDWGKTEEARGVRILPLLVTDDLEATIRSRSVDQVREIALALSATIHGVGVGGDLQKLNEELRTSLGRDLNATFTVARVSENTLRCRIGAQQTPVGGYALIPQTHTVSLLVLVPKSKTDKQEPADRKLRLVCRTELKNVATGTSLPVRSRDETYAAVKKVLLWHGVPGAEIASAKEIGAIVHASTANDYPAFIKSLQAVTAITPDPDDRFLFAEAIWVDVVSVRNGGHFSTASFQVPKSRTPALSADGQTPLLIDDGKNLLTANVRGGSDLRARDVVATLVVGDKRFAATSVKLIDEGREIQLIFPSLAALKVPTTDCEAAKLEMLVPGKTGPAGTTGSVACRYLTKPDARQPGFKANATSTYVISQNGTGTVQLVFDTEPTSGSVMQFTVQGADVAEVIPPTAATRNGGVWKVASAGAVTLRLTNLTTLSQVRIKAVDAANKAELPEISLPVLEAAERSTHAVGGG